MHRFGNSLNSCTGKLYMLKGLYQPNKVNCRFHLQVGRLKFNKLAKRADKNLAKYRLILEPRVSLVWQGDSELVYLI